MTLGIGLKCPEGVVLITDSMAVTVNEFAVPSPVPGYRKNSWLRAARAVAILSGTATDELFDVRPETNIEDAATALWTSIRDFEEQWLAQFQPGVARYLRGANDPDLQDFPQLLVGGGHQGEPPQLARFRPSGVEWATNGGPALYVVGCWTYSWPELQGKVKGPVPTRLDDATAFALRLSREFLDFAYQGKTLDQHIAEGHMLSIGYPLHVTTFDSDGNCHEEEIGE